MSGPDRARVREVFLAACSLPPAERDLHVAEACGDDDALRREVESLLAHHDEGTLIAPRAPAGPRRVSTVLLGASAAFCAVVAVGFELAERHHERRLIASLDAAVTEARAALERRLDLEAARLRDVTESPEVEAAIARYRRDGDVESVDAAIAPRLPRGNLGYALLSEDAEILVAAPAGEPPRPGGALSEEGRELFERLQRSSAATTPLAFPRGALVRGNEPSTDERVFALAASVGAAWCVVVFGEGSLAAAVGSTRVDAGTASYVIDAAGVSLTPLPDRGLELLAAIRRPDGRPTRAVEEACRGTDGVDAGGYADARGVEVAGAWRWLPEWSVGVVTEIDLATALAPLDPLRLARRASLFAAAVALLAFLLARAPR